MLGKTTIEEDVLDYISRADFNSAFGLFEMVSVDVSEEKSSVEQLENELAQIVKEKREMTIKEQNGYNELIHGENGVVSSLIKKIRDYADSKSV